MLEWNISFDEAMDSAHSVEEWFVPLSEEKRTLREAYTELLAFGLKQEDIPLIIQMVENPKFDLPGIDIFHGSTDLRTHDFIHILLGRGVMIKDEAFVIGFTMGSTNRVTTTEERLFFIGDPIFLSEGVSVYFRGSAGVSGCGAAGLCLRLSASGGGEFRLLSRSAIGTDQGSHWIGSEFAEGLL